MKKILFIVILLLAPASSFAIVNNFDFYSNPGYLTVNTEESGMLFGGVYEATFYDSSGTFISQTSLGGGVNSPQIVSANSSLGSPGALIGVVLHSPTQDCQAGNLNYSQCSSLTLPTDHAGITIPGFGCTYSTATNPTGSRYTYIDDGSCSFIINFSTTTLIDIGTSSNFVIANASTTLYTQDAGNISFLLCILIVLAGLVFMGLYFNTLQGKR